MNENVTVVVLYFLGLIEYTYVSNEIRKTLVMNFVMYLSVHRLLIRDAHRPTCHIHPCIDTPIQKHDEW